MALVLDGGLSDRVEVPSGTDAPIRTYPITCGTHTTVTVRAGVERTAGGYNFGQAATVVTP
jgi:hypothetical protein